MPALPPPRCVEGPSQISLDGRVAVVTGAGRGIGRAVACRLAAAGAKVAALSRTQSSVDDVVGEITRAGGEALGVACDVSERDEVFGAVDEVVRRWDRLDVLVNCAQGFGSRSSPALTTPLQPLETSDESVWDYTLRSGLWATLWAMKAAFPAMQARRYGRIVNFGSPAGQFGQEGNAAYNATKEAIRALSRTAAREWGRSGITVNVVNPSVRTDAMDAMFRQRTDAENSARLESLPLRDFGGPDDVAHLVLFLASDLATYITGDTMMIDSGLFIRP
jgi:NAD(P)-dependent dehydrogenase (short-subunit alcohol dehydrogenase family)